MRKARVYKDFILCTGLIPAIICMILCCILTDAAVLYICSIASLVYAAYRFFHPDVLEYNTLSLHTALVLATLAAAKVLGGDWILPEDTVPLTLEILIFSLSILYLLTASYYSRFFTKLNHLTGVNNYWATMVVIIASLIHLFIFAVIYAFCHPLSDKLHFFLTSLAPPLTYLAAIRLNYYYIGRCMQEVKSIPILRVAAVCNGKVYVTPMQGEKLYWDYPMRDVCLDSKDPVKACLTHIRKKYQENLSQDPDFRFSLKYLFETPFGSSVNVLLYILPLKDEGDIHFEGGRFVAPSEIARDTDKQFSLFLKKEAEHLDMAVEMWKDYQ